MLRRLLLAVLAASILGTAPFSFSQEEAPKKFRSVQIEYPRFTHDRIGLLNLECEKAATFLSVWVWRNLADPIRAGKKEARVIARRFLALALHMDPQNVAAMRINELLVEGKRLPEPLNLPQEPKFFVESIMRLVTRLNESAKPEELQLAGFLALAGAEIDPANEDAIYHAELFARKHESLAQEWKTLAFGRKPKS